MYDTYKDVNGVTWTIVQGANSMSAYVADTQERRYIPDAPDIGPVQRASTDPSEQAEADRQRFVMLRAKIDEYASEHAANVGLQVTASAGGIPWWAWLVVGYLVMRK